MRGENHTINDYDIGQLLGRGGFATVYRARERSTGHVFALKIMEKSYISKHKMEIRVQNEIRIQSELTSRGIVKLYRDFEDADYVYMVLELCEGGNLYKHLKTHGPLSEMEARSIIRQLLVALEYMHGLGVVHRDLKLSNVLLVSSSQESSMDSDSVTDFVVKLCDFGLAVQIEHPDEEHFTLCGTPNYIAPEVASQQAHGFPADLWSVGCLFYSLLTGAPPFEQAGGVKETLQCIMAGRYTVPAGLSEEANDFMKCLIQLNPRHRSSVTEILRHQFLLRDNIKREHSAPPTSSSIRRSLFRGEAAPHVLAPHSNGRCTKANTVTASVEYSTILLNDSRAYNTLNAAPCRDKVLLQKAGGTQGHSIHSNSADMSSSSSLSSSSPSKSVANTSTTAVSEFHGYQPQHSQIKSDSVRIRGGTGPSTEEDAGNRRDALSRRTPSHGRKDFKHVDSSQKDSIKYCWNRNGHRCREDDRDGLQGPESSKRDSLRGPTRSVEPEMSTHPVLTSHTPPYSSSSISLQSRPHQQNPNAMKESDNSAPSSWLHAIRSIRQSVDGIGAPEGSYSGPSVGSMCSRDRGATTPYTSTISTIDLGSSMGSLRGVFGVSGQTESGSSSRTSHATISHSDTGGHLSKSLQAQNSHNTHTNDYQQLRRNHHTQAVHASTASFRHSQSRREDVHADTRDSLSRSVSIENVTMNGLNWFGDVSSALASHSTTDRFSVVLPSNEILTLDGKGRAMFCGVIKDKNGRSLPCRLFSDIRSPHKVTLGKLDEGMLQEYRSLWATGKQCEGDDDDDDEDGMDTDNDDDTGSESDSNNIYEKHDRLLKSTRSTTDTGVESISVQGSESTAKETKSPYSEFDSFYNCDSGDESDVVSRTEAPLKIPAPPKKQPLIASKQKRLTRANMRATKSATLLRNVETSRLFSDELLLRSYSVTTHALGGLSASSLQHSISHDARSSLSSPGSLSRSLSGDPRTGSQTLPSLPSALVALYGRGAETFENHRRTAPRVIMYVPATVQSSSSDPAQAIALKCCLMSNGPLPDMHCRWANGLSLQYSLETGRTSIHCPPHVLPHGLFDTYKASLSTCSKNSTVTNRTKTIDKPEKLKETGYHWEGNLINSINRSSSSGSSMTCSTASSRSFDTAADLNPIPNALKTYVELAQKALRRCLKEDAAMSRAFQSRSSSQHKSLHDVPVLYGAAQHSRKAAEATAYSSAPSLPRVFVEQL